MRSRLRTSWWSSSLNSYTRQYFLQRTSKISSKLGSSQQQYQQFGNVSYEQIKRRLYEDRPPYVLLRDVARKALLHLENKPHLFFLFGAAAVLPQLFLDRVPISGRWRINFKSDRLLKAGTPRSLLDDLEYWETTALPDTAPEVKLVHKVFNRLILSNDLQHIASSMKIVVTVDKHATSYLCVWCGTLLINRSFLKIADSEDLLALAIGHEIGHAVADHVGESLSLRAVCWPVCFLAALPFSWYHGDLSCVDFIYNMLVRLPLRRRQELEADYIGLIITARSCYNLEAAPLLNERIDMASEAQAYSVRVWHREPRFVSTHPPAHERVQKVKEWYKQRSPVFQTIAEMIRLPEALAQAWTHCSVARSNPLQAF